MSLRNPLLFVCFLVLALSLAGQDLPSMQKTADDWEYSCRNELHIEPGTLPWIIFYDSVTAWHINPDLALLPVRTRPTLSVRFAGVDYPLAQVDHDKGKLWVPDHDPIDVKTRAAATMPVSNNTKTFFIQARNCELILERIWINSRIAAVILKISAEDNVQRIFA